MNITKMEVSIEKTTNIEVSSGKTTNEESEGNSGKKRKLSDTGQEAESSSEKRLNSDEKRIENECSLNSGENGVVDKISLSVGEKEIASENSLNTVEKRVAGEKGIASESSLDTGEKRVARENSMNAGERVAGKNSLNSGEKGIASENSLDSGEKRVAGEKVVTGKNSLNFGDERVVSENTLNLGEKGVASKNGLKIGEKRVSDEKSLNSGEKRIASEKCLNTGEKRVAGESLNMGGKRDAGENRLNIGVEGVIDQNIMSTVEKGVASEKSLGTVEKRVAGESVETVKKATESGSTSENVSREQAGVGSTKVGETKPKSCNEILSLILKTIETSGEGNKNAGVRAENTISTNGDESNHLSNTRKLKLRAQKIQTDSRKELEHKKDSKERIQTSFRKILPKPSSSSAVPESSNKRNAKSNEISLPAQDHLSKTSQSLQAWSNSTLLPFRGQPDGTLLPFEGEADGTLLPDGDPCDEGKLPVLTISDTFITSIHKGKVEMIVIPSTEELKWKIREDQIRVEKTCELLGGEVAIEGPEDLSDDLPGAHDTILPYQGSRSTSYTSSLLSKGKSHQTENVGRAHVVSKDYSKESRKDHVAALRAVRVPVHNLDKVKGLIKQLGANKQKMDNNNAQSNDASKAVKTKRYTSRDFDFIKSNSMHRDPWNIAVKSSTTASGNISSLKRPQPTRESEVTAKKPCIGDSVDVQHRTTETKSLTNSNKNSANLIKSSLEQDKQPKILSTIRIVKEHDGGNMPKPSKESISRNEIVGNLPKPSKELISENEIATKESDTISNRSSTEGLVVSSVRLDVMSPANTKQELNEGKINPAVRVGVAEGMVSRSQNTLADSSSILEIQNPISIDRSKEGLSKDTIRSSVPIRKEASNAEMVSPSVSTILNDSVNFVPNPDISAIIKVEESDPLALPEIESVQSKCSQNKVFPNLFRALSEAKDDGNKITCSSGKPLPTLVRWHGMEEENPHPFNQSSPVKLSSLSTEQAPDTISYELALKEKAENSSPQSRSLMQTLQTQPIGNVLAQTTPDKTGSPMEGTMNTGNFITSAQTFEFETPLPQGKDHNDTISANKTAQDASGAKVCEENMLSDLDLLNLSVEEVFIMDETPQIGMPTLRSIKHESEFVGFPAEESKERVGSNKIDIPIASTDKKLILGKDVSFPFPRGDVPVASTAKKLIRGKDDSFPFPQGENYVFLEKTREDCPMCYTVIDIKTVVVDMNNLSFTFTCTKCLLLIVFTFEALKKYISEIMGTPEMNFSGLCEFKDWCKETQEKAKISSSRQTQIVPKKKKDKLPIMAAYRKTSKGKKDKGKPAKGLGLYKTVTGANFLSEKAKFASPKKNKKSQKGFRSPQKKLGGTLASVDMKRINRDYLKDRNAVRFVALNNKGEVEVSTSF